MEYMTGTMKDNGTFDMKLNISASTLHHGIHDRQHAGTFGAK